MLLKSNWMLSQMLLPAALLTLGCIVSINKLKRET